VEDVGVCNYPHSEQQTATLQRTIFKVVGILVIEKSDHDFQTKGTIANLSKRFDIWHVHRPASAEPLEARQISLDKRIFLRVRPSLELAFSHDGVRFSRKRFLVDENDGRSAARPHGTTSGVVCRYSFADIGTVSDVKATIGTAKDVNEEGTAFNHPRRPQRMPFDKLRSTSSRRAGHSTRCFGGLQVCKKKALVDG
jgi:hypothetical protein